MSKITHFIVIRDYKPGDEYQCREIVKEGTMATVNNAFFSLIEVTFQLMVLSTAAMFIFFGLPFTVCLGSIPGVIIFMYMCVWAGHLFKSVELTQDLGNIPRVYMSSDSTGFWVAEAFEPVFMNNEPSHFKYSIFSEKEYKHKQIDVSSYRKTLVGTVGIVKSQISEDCAWLRRMAVRPKYQCMGIGKALLNEALQFCNEKYQGVELVTTEWHDSARTLYIKRGFQLKQMYHKQLLGSIVAILIYQLHYKVQPNQISITP
uniref:N-acetyltransferase domain-containing protein n=1 Tax=Homalodisca liturata TaxID=320908 RepID=A0A1B6J7M3_9HEMI